jgi:hypothetical protein
MLVSGDCGQPEVPPHTAGRIVNGEEATPHSFPWMVNKDDVDNIYTVSYLFVYSPNTYGQGYKGQGTRDKGQGLWYKILWKFNFFNCSL